MRILIFGKLGDAIGREVRVEPPGDKCTVAELRKLLTKQFPAAEADLSSPWLRACVNDTIVGEQFLVDRAGEVEFFPPLSGG